MVVYAGDTAEFRGVLFSGQVSGIWGFLSSQSGSEAFSVSDWSAYASSSSYTTELIPDLTSGVNLEAHQGTPDRSIVADRVITRSNNVSLFPVAPTCSDADTVEHGNLYGYNSDLPITVHYADSCVVESVFASGHAFTLTESRDVTFTLTPLTQELVNYTMAVYRGSITGNALQSISGTSQASRTITGLNITAGQQHTVLISGTNNAVNRRFSLRLQYGFIQPPTPTPAPTPTPRVQPNLDFRLHPDPVGVAYEAGATYQFELEGQSHLYPVTVRSANPAALELNTSSSVTCDITAADSVEVDDGDTFYVKACTAGRNTTLEVVSEAGDYLAEYSIYVSQGTRPTLTAATVTQGMGEDVSQRDELGLGIVIGSVCSGFGVGCDTRLITNLIATALAVGVMALLLQRSRGAATSMSVGVAAAFAVVAMMLAYLWVGFPLWIVGVALIVILGTGGIAAVAKAKQVG